MDGPRTSVVLPMPSAWASWRKAAIEQVLTQWPTDFNGVDVFWRRADGNWKIYISHAVPAGS
ncbi:hypothetical protein [Antrihabitans stalactiti]|uniref:Uncharacterized protein n=1 Tax=Antrihabitans stalactiti TaxID=2584121 RepID=A0A848KQR3_9NOCA|nr:hypothetical protein [Antrihabitans stalactiti]NMN98932.1 hypothetical protein [Antrihabitans stalactiti]